MAARGTYTTIYRKKLADLAAGELTESVRDNLPIMWFAVGEGGFTLLPNGTKTPSLPEASREALVSTIPMANNTESTTGGFFTKTIDPLDVSINNRDVTVRCVLSATEAGLDNRSRLTGNANGNPHLFELGIFDGDPNTAPATLMAYCTFDEIVKISGVQVAIEITIKY